MTVEVMEMEEMEIKEVNEFENSFMEEAQSAVAVTVAPNVKTASNDLVKGFLIGLGTGLVIGAAAWFNERNKRMAILKQLELSTEVAEGIGKGKDKVVFNKKEIELTEVIINNPTTYVKVIMDNIDQVKWMRKSERERWQKCMTNIATLSIAWYQTGTATDTIGTEIPEDEATEVLKEK